MGRYQPVTTRPPRPCRWATSLLLLGLVTCSGPSAGAFAVIRGEASRTDEAPSAEPLRAPATDGEAQGPLSHEHVPASVLAHASSRRQPPGHPAGNRAAGIAARGPSRAPMPTAIPATMMNATAASTPSSGTPSAPLTGTTQPYRSVAGGYAIDLPPHWTIREVVQPDGTVVTTVAPPTRGLGITIIVGAGTSLGEAADVPHTRCQPITVAGLPGHRCIDTLTFGISTTLVGAGKRYTIATLSKGGASDVYAQVVASFQVLP